MALKEKKRSPLEERGRSLKNEGRSNDRPLRPGRGDTAAKPGETQSTLTTANKILVSAVRLAENQEQFTAEDLIVKAWKDYPESFGLSGYREAHPDSNRVLSKLMGSVGLCSRGWLEQVSTKTYRMTPAGRKFAHALMSGKTEVESPAAARAAARAASTPTEKPAKAEAPARPRIEPIGPPRTPSRAEIRLREIREQRAAAAASSAKAAATAKAAPAAPPPQPPAPPPPPPPPPSPPPDYKPGEGGKFESSHGLQRLVTSVASQKFSRGGLVTYADACAFWAITPAMHPSHLAQRLEEIEALLKRAEYHIQALGAPIKIHERLEVTLTTVVGLQGLHRMLMQKYHRELDAIRTRYGD
jgi:hypothetical protein